MMELPWTRIERWRKGISRLMAGLLITALCFGNRTGEENEVLTGLEFLAGIFLIGVGTLGRLWCSVYVAGNKTSDLIIVGPYSVCRHPLYFFSLVAALGVGFASETITLPVVIVVFYALYYPRVIRDEDAKLLSIYGERFEIYRNRVPAFVPKVSLLVEPEQHTTNVRIFRNHLLSALWFVWFVGVLELAEMLHEVHWLPTLFPFY